MVAKIRKQTDLSTGDTRKIINNLKAINNAMQNINLKNSPESKIYLEVDEVIGQDNNDFIQPRKTSINVAGNKSITPATTANMMERINFNSGVFPAVDKEYKSDNNNTIQPTKAVMDTNSLSKYTLENTCKTNRERSLFIRGQWEELEDEATETYNIKLSKLPSQNNDKCKQDQEAKDTIQPAKASKLDENMPDKPLQMATDTRMDTKTSSAIQQQEMLLAARMDRNNALLQQIAGKLGMMDSPPSDSSTESSKHPRRKHRPRPTPERGKDKDKKERNEDGGG